MNQIVSSVDVAHSLSFRVSPDHSAVWAFLLHTVRCVLSPLFSSMLFDAIVPMCVVSSRANSRVWIEKVRSTGRECVSGRREARTARSNRVCVYECVRALLDDCATVCSSDIWLRAVRMIFLGFGYRVLHLDLFFQRHTSYSSFEYQICFQIHVLKTVMIDPGMKLGIQATAP